MGIRTIMETYGANTNTSVVMPIKFSNWNYTFIVQMELKMFQKVGKRRFHRDLNSDRGIQSPKC